MNNDQNMQPHLHLIPNKFPEISFSGFGDETIALILQHIQSHPKFDSATDKITCTPHIIQFTSSQEDMPTLTDTEFTNCILTAISHHDIDPIEYSIRNITEDLSLHHFYFRLLTINP